MEIVYLFHFSRRINERHTCQHYTGYTANLERRLKKHLAGNGSKLCKAALEKGITWEMVRTWEVPDGEGRKLELKIKNGAKRFCPHCREQYLERKRIHDRKRRMRDGE